MVDRSDPDAARLWHHLPIIVYLLAFVIQYATIFDNFIPEASRFSRVIQLVMIVLYLAKAVAVKDIALACWGAAGFGVLIFWHLLFCKLSGQAMNFNAILGYLPLLCYVPIAGSSLSLNWQLRWLFILSTLYLFVYVAGNHHLVAAATSVAAQDAGGLVNSSDSRGTRVFIAALLASFVAFYAYEDDELPLVIRIVAVLLAAAAAVMSQSRAFGAVFLVIMTLRALRLNNRVSMTLLTLVFLGVSATHLSGVLLPGWNPFFYLISDNSSYGRYLEYNQAMAVIHQHWLLGLGIEPDSDAMGVYLNIPHYLTTIFWSDLGAIGPLGQFGLPGLTFFMIASVACLMGGARMSGDRARNAIRLNGAASALNGIISPTILYPPGVFFTMVLFGIWLRDRRLEQLSSPEPAWSETPA